MSEDHLSTLFFIEMSKERLEKSERTPPVSWRPWALAYSRDRPYNLSCLSAMSKNGRLRSFSSALGCHLARKSLWWPAMLVSNKKQEFEQRKRIKLFDDFWVRAYRFDFSPRRRCTRVKVIRVEVSQNVVHARTTGWMTSTRPGKLRDFGLQPRRSNPRSRNLLWDLGVKSTWFLNFGGQAKCIFVLVVDSWPSLVVFGVVIPLWVKKHE